MHSFSFIIPHVPIIATKTIITPIIITIIGIVKNTLLANPLKFPKLEWKCMANPSKISPVILKQIILIKYVLLFGSQKCNCFIYREYSIENMKKTLC